MSNDGRNPEDRTLDYVKGTQRLEGLEPDPQMDAVVKAVAGGEMSPERAIRLSRELARQEAHPEKQP